MPNDSAFESWLEETYQMTLSDYNMLDLERQCELGAEFSDDMVMEMR